VALLIQADKLVICATLKRVHGLRNNFGNFAMFAAIRRASSLVSNFAAERRPPLGGRVTFFVLAYATTFAAQLGLFR